MATDTREFKKGKKKSTDLIDGIPVDARTGITVAQMGLGFVPYGDVAGAGLEMVTADMDVKENLDKAKSIMGDDVRHLKSSSKAFRDYATRLNNTYQDRFIDFAVMSGGAIAGPALVGMVFGPPGLIVGLGAGLAGGWAASEIKQRVMPDTQDEFVNFAAKLHDMGLAGELPAEESFVARLMNMKSKGDMRRIMDYLQEQDPSLKDMNAIVKALEDPNDERRLVINKAMKKFDTEIRRSIGATIALRGENVSERLAMEANLGKISGVDLLDGDKCDHFGVLLNSANLQQLMAEDKGAALVNVNHRLPRKDKGKSHGPDWNMPA